MKKRNVRAAGKFLSLCLLALGFVVLARGEAKADTIVIALSDPGGSVPLLIPAGQVITSVSYKADYTAIQTRPCTFSDPCDSLSTIPRGRIFLNGAIIFNADQTSSGTITKAIDSNFFNNFTFGSAYLSFDTHRISLVLGNGLLTVQTAPAQTPEPATLLLLGTGLSGVAAVSRARRKRGIKRAG
jgi:hypothetical protein